MLCPQCHSPETRLCEPSRDRWLCKVCKARFTPNPKKRGRKPVGDRARTTAERVKSHRNRKKNATMSNPVKPFDFDHDYQVELSIGYISTRRTTINPCRSGDFESEAEWVELGEEEQEAWLDTQAEAWASNYINLSVTP